MSCKALLVDLDGVIRDWPKDYTDIEHPNGLPAGAITKAAFDPQFLTPAIKGHITDDRWRQDIGDELLRRYPQANVSSAMTAWSAGAGVVNTSALQLLLNSASNKKLVLLTNATSRLAVDLEALGISGHFSSVINTSEVGWIKPEKEIYQYARSVCDLSLIHI